MIREKLGKELLFLDGGMGTLLQERGLAPGELPETWNLIHPEQIREIHRSYIEAGSDIVLTNTFGANALKFHADGFSLEQTVKRAVGLVREAAEEAENESGKAQQSSGKRRIYTALDIGPTGKLLKPMGDLDFEEAYEAFKEVMVWGEEAGADLIHIETMSDTYELKAAVLAAKENTSLPVFATAIFDERRKLLTGADVPSVIALLEGLHVDALGINCGMGPEQMMPVLEEYVKYSSLPIIVKPNAGLPKQRGGQTYYDVSPDEFAGYMEKIVSMGACVIGGCCGTNPSYISKLAHTLGHRPVGRRLTDAPEQRAESEIRYDNNLFIRKLYSGEKVVIAELDPPFDGNDAKMMEAAGVLKRAGVEMITFSDSPMGKMRASAVMSAVKVSSRLQIDTMPHMACRDRNTIGIGSEILGAYMNGVRNFLFVTGDPVPAGERGSITSVYDYHSVTLMNYVRQLNREHFAEDPIAYGGALNYGRKNIDVEIRRMQKKCEAGASFFLTQPIYSDEDIERIRYIKSRIDTKIICGIMPLVSYRNALFMKNEITGIHVPDEIIAQYDKDMSREEAQTVGVRIAAEIAEKLADTADGYYFMVPFNRAGMIAEIIESAAFSQGCRKNSN